MINWDNFLNYGDSFQDAFETLCTQLFERYIRRNYKDDIVKIRVINSDAGDGGVEAYAQLKSGQIIAVQAKGFREVMGRVQIGQLRSSITTALSLRKNITEYIFCIPSSLGSEKFGRGKKGMSKKPVLNTEEKAIEAFTDEIEKAYPKVKITWWFSQEIELEMQQEDNEGVQRFWFDKELISMKLLRQQFELQKNSWLFKRYIPQLHAQGFIQKDVDQLLYNESFRKAFHQNLLEKISPLTTGVNLLYRFTEPMAESSLKKSLQEIRQQLNNNLSKILPVGKEIDEGKDYFGEEKIENIKIPRSILDEIGSVKAKNKQFGIQERLINNLDAIAQLNLQNLLESLHEGSKQTSRLFLGNPGTGKTHALSNTVDKHLSGANLPAIIIRAKGSGQSNWTEILQCALELYDWNKDEILTAFENMSIRMDISEAKKLQPNEELLKASSKVVICIDGLEEDTAHWSNWYQRMRESVELIKIFPRVRFIYSAREYFFKKDELPVDRGFKVRYLPDEGDVPIFKMAEQYFSPEHYNIKLESKSLIRGIDSLYALRLFCELYAGKTLTSTDDIITAERKLLNQKVERLNNELGQAYNRDIGSTRKPISEGLNIVCDMFYSKSEIEHDELFNELNVTIGKYLDKKEIDLLIDYLANNGFLVKSEVPVENSFPEKIRTFYTLAYQSVMELIMVNKVVSSIRAKTIDQIPKHLLALSSDKKNERHNLLNQRIVQGIANTLFQEDKILIGEDGFLSGGIDSETMTEIELNAYIYSSSAVDQKYKRRVDKLFLKDYQSRYFIFQELIYPSASLGSNIFGGEYLHEILIAQPTSFEREEIWLGGDHYGHNDDDLPYNEKIRNNDIKDIIDPNPEASLTLPEFSLHNELPLIFGWALATIDQKFRERLRTALTRWALEQPVEFLKLLDKLFFCNDPQIQEDLASVTLGVASKLNNRDAIKQIAEWALLNVFAKFETYRNIIVRQGFRAIVERAVQYNLIDERKAISARPKKIEEIDLLPIDLEIVNGANEIYPIVHDLAWYVIKRSYNDFMKSGYNKDANKVDEKTSNKLLKKYADILQKDSLDPHSWAMSVAIEYMRSLGFARVRGNGFTQASHGSKSKIFTLEEKYTWLAVHYIQGYLSDFLPLIDTGETVKDYTQIVDVPNPADFFQFDEESPFVENYNFVIEDVLVPEVEISDDFDKAISDVVEKEPAIDFSKWIRLKQSDFLDGEKDLEPLFALYNYTSLHESNRYLYGHIDVRAVIIEKGQARKILELALNKKRGNFIEHIDRLIGSPATGTYSNPSDIVWMEWIEEDESHEIYYDGLEEKEMGYTVTSVTSNNVDGESETYIPSKYVRGLLGINEMNGNVLLNNKGDVKGYIKKIKSIDSDMQEITAVLEGEVIKSLEQDTKELVWLVDYFLSKDALNEEIRSENHAMRSRKYLVFIEDGEFVSTKVWDERFSNMRDDDTNEQEQIDIKITYDDEGE